MYIGRKHCQLAFIAPSQPGSSFLEKGKILKPYHASMCKAAPKASAEDPTPPSGPRRPARKSSNFEKTIDDLTMKRLGRGSIFYGTRPDDSEVEEPAFDDTPKPDPVLVTGGTGRTGQWVALGLLNQEFNVRCFARNVQAAEKIFGPSGSNLDVCKGDIRNYEDVSAAVDGSIAIVCASGSPWWVPGGFANTDVKGVRHLVDAARKAGGIRRFVLVSTITDTDGRGGAKRQAEKIVIDSGLPYTIIRAASLSDDEGGLHNIMISADNNKGGTGELSRVDLAQAICQALVYDRTIADLNKSDEDGNFDFPNCIVHLDNGPDIYTPEKRFWKKAFSRISEAYREQEEAVDLPS